MSLELCLAYQHERAWVGLLERACSSMIEYSWVWSGYCNKHVQVCSSRLSTVRYGLVIGTSMFKHGRVIVTNMVGYGRVIGMSNDGGALTPL